MSAIKLSDILANTRLPLPGKSWLTIQQRVDAGASMKEISAIVETDPALAAKVLSYANSAAYGRGEPVTSVNKAVLRLGSNLISCLALFVHLAGRFNGKRTPGFDYDGFWAHSTAFGSAMRTMVRQQGHSTLTPDDAFTMGLLSHIGWLCLAQTRPELFSSGEAIEPLLPMPMQHISARYLEHIGLPADLYNFLLEPTKACGKAMSSVAKIIHQAHLIADRLAPFANEQVNEEAAELPDGYLDDWRQWQGLIAA